VDILLTEVLAVSEPTVMSGGAIKVVRLDVCVRNRGFVRLEVPQPAAKQAVALATELSRRIEPFNTPTMQVRVLFNRVRIPGSRSVYRDCQMAGCAATRPFEPAVRAAASAAKSSSGRAMPEGRSQP